MVSDFEGQRTQTEGFWEQQAEDYIWIKETWSSKGLQ
jgi:hypothetical protein